MTVQTVAGVPVLDSGDFQNTSKGVTWGLKVRYVPTPDGSQAMDVVIAELVSGVWTFKQTAVSDAQGALESMGLSSFLTSRLLPAINTWLKSRFPSSTPSPTPTPAPGVPSSVSQLDTALKSLKVTIGADGVPVISQ